MTKLRTVLAAGIVAAAATSFTPAGATSDVKEIALKDGATLLIFKDGKMSMRDKQGRTMGMKDGQEMETRDGKKLMMRGNEIWRVTEREELYRGN